MESWTNEKTYVYHEIEKKDIVRGIWNFGRKLSDYN